MLPGHSHSTQQRRGLARHAQFVAVVIGIAVLWLAVLPWLARQPQIADYIQEQQAQQIDPSAMFYSELEILPAIAHRIERLHEYYGFSYEHETHADRDRGD